MPNGTPGGASGVAGREAIRISLASIATYYVAKVVPAEILGDVEILVMVGIAAAIAFAGQKLRDSGSAVGNVV